MRVILEFNLPDEAEEYKTATRAGAMACVIDDIKMYIRSKLKHSDPTPEVETELKYIRDIIHEGLRDE